MSPAGFLNRRYVALMAAVLALLALTGIAQAAPADSSGNASPPVCPSATLCTYQNANFDVDGGNWWYYSYSNHSDGKWFYVGNAAQDQISSINNSRAWWSYMAYNCPADGTNIGVSGNGFKYSDLSQGPPAGPSVPNGDTGLYNDAISAIAFATSASQQAGHFPAHGPRC